jgi:hypothetical protein
MSSIRAARKYHWRLAGGRLIASDAGLRFEPNRLERWRADTSWECSPEDVVEIRVHGIMWVVVETELAAETFRVFGAAAVVLRLKEALHLAASAQA